MTAPISRTPPVLALYMAALKFGIVEPRKRQRVSNPYQLPLPDAAKQQAGEGLPLEGERC